MTTGLLVPESATGSDDAFVRKFAPNGATLWTRQFGSKRFGSPLTDTVTALTVDGAGNAYVGGNAEGSFDDTTLMNGAFLLKFGPEGDVLWTRQFNACRDTLSGAVAPPAGLVVAGSTCASLGSSNNSALVDLYVRL